MSATMFRAIFWKEIRANLKWAVFVLLLMGGGLFYKLGLVDSLPEGTMDLNGLARFVNELEAAAALGGALAGLLFGAAQVRVENRGDKWGFLVHRPVSRSRLFWGKAAAGILLYAISTGVPLAVAWFRVATPENLPVLYDWRITLPVIANLLCGLVFYFAGLLTVMREARWYASRGLGIGAALGCLGLQVATATAFWQAVAICAVGLAIVGTAAWSTFVAGGQYGIQPRAGRIATGLAIGIGMAIVGGFVLLVVVEPLQQRTVPAVRFTGDTSYDVTSDGQFVRITREDSRIVAATDLDGRPVEYDGSHPDVYGGPGVMSARLRSQSQAIPSIQTLNWLFKGLRSATDDYPVSWYYAQRLGLIAAYDTQSHKLIGWLGPDGFSTGEARPRSFAGRLEKLTTSGDTYLLMLRHAVYRVDLDKRRVEEVFQSGPPETILDVTVPRYSSTLATPGADFEVFWTTRRVILQVPDRTRLLEAPQDASAWEYPGLQVYRALLAPGTPTFLWYKGNSTTPDLVAEFDGGGTVVNSWTFPSDIPVSERSRLGITTYSALLPIVGQAAFDAITRAQVPRTKLPLSGPARTLHWAVAILSSLLCATVVLLRGRAYAFPPGRLLAWTAMVVLFGPLGLLTMLALIEWPARESCPACSRKRVVVRERCEHCGAPFPAPARDGTEIFEPAMANPSA